MDTTTHEFFVKRMPQELHCGTKSQTTSMFFGWQPIKFASQSIAKKVWK